MTESPEPVTAPESDPLMGETTRTGVPAVDDVLAEVEALHDAPLDEHLGVFEKAHDALRGALDADPGEPA